MPCKPTTSNAMSNHMPKPGLSVVVITLNERKWIAECLESASFADEIIVVDSGSTDGTTEIAARYTDKIFTRKFDDFSAQKNYAIDRASHRWIFVLDADELISEPLREEIVRIVRTDKQEAYSVVSVNLFMDREMKHSGMGGHRKITLFPYSVRYAPARVHEKPDVEGLETVRLKGAIIHRTYRDYRHMLHKTDLYSTLWATDKFKSGKKASAPKILLKPGFTFFRHYILQMGFLDGISGLVFSGMRAFDSFLRLTKLWRMNHSKEDQEVY